jgi:hypothetical protein
MSLIFNASGTDGINSTVNYTVPTGAAAMFMLKALLKRAGWSVIKSGDGLSAYSSSADIITSASSGANGMDNPRAWFVVQMPSSGRAFCIQRNTSSGADTGKSWRIKYSKSAGFTTGSPSATVVPSTGGDEQVLLGAGSDGSPTMAVLFLHGDAAMRFNCFADNAAPYGFLMWEWAISTGVAGCAFGLDPLTGYSSSDTDPYVIHLLGTAAAWQPSSIGTSGPGTGGGQLCFWYGSTWYARGVTALAGTPSPIAVTGVTGSGYGALFSVGWGQGVSSVIDSKDNLLPLMAFIIVSWGSLNVAPQVFYPKGFLSFVRAIIQSNRYTGDLYTVSSAKDGVAVGNPVAYVVLPWDGSSSPLI